MKITKLVKGETIHLQNFPKVHFLLVKEGRLEVRWFNLDESEESG